MCGRFAGLSYNEVAQVVAENQQGILSSAAPGWSEDGADVRPGSRAWAIAPLVDSRANDSLALELVPRELTWGFAVDWSKRPVFNTRIETATGSNPGMWRDAMRNGRCIVPSRWFYEPHAVETVPSPTLGKPMKRQYQFEMPDGGVLLMAAVMQDGRFSIVTTEPNAAVAPIHDRMPLVLRFSEVKTWLGDGFGSLADRSDVLLKSSAEPLPERSQLSLF